MRYRIPRKKRKIHLTTIIKIILFTIFYGFLMFGGFFTGSAIITALTDSLSTTYPIMIPTIHNQEECETTGKVWLDRKCLDYKYSTLF